MNSAAKGVAPILLAGGIGTYFISRQGGDGAHEASPAASLGGPGDLGDCAAWGIDGRAAGYGYVEGDAAGYGPVATSALRIATGFLHVAPLAWAAALQLLLLAVALTEAGTKVGDFCGAVAEMVQSAFGAAPSLRRSVLFGLPVAALSFLAALLDAASAPERWLRPLYCALRADLSLSAMELQQGLRFLAFLSVAALSRVLREFLRARARVAAGDRALAEARAALEAMGAHNRSLVAAYVDLAAKLDASEGDAASLRSEVDAMQLVLQNEIADAARREEEDASLFGEGESLLEGLRDAQSSGASSRSDVSRGSPPRDRLRGLAETVVQEDHSGSGRGLGQAPFL